MGMRNKETEVQRPRETSRDGAGGDGEGLSCVCSERSEFGPELPSPEQPKN